jgi:hypothetical protein
MVQAKPISPETRQYLKRTQCAFANKVPYVCCAESLSITMSTTEAPIKKSEGTSPQALKKLKELLPQPPHCGGDSQDRIFGGSETEINEFPWLVLLS